RQDPSVVATERPVVGRKPVLAQFARTVDSCLASGRGQGVMLLGPTGSGKSRLIEELAAMAAAKGFRRIGLRNCGFGEAEAAGEVERQWRAALYALFYLPHDGESRPSWQLRDAKGRENGLQSVLRALMRLGPGGGPLLLTIEDIHHASPRTVAQLAGVVSDLD